MDLKKQQYWCFEELAKNGRCFCVDSRHNLILLIGTKNGTIFTVNLGEILFALKCFVFFKSSKIN